uniref:2,4-dienoyl-CoA reductase n=1 Tax=Solanum tuberosum TaxID=4113 RepID=M1DYN5_SOLTU
MEPRKDLSGKVVMVTGASSGIGLEFCLDLAKAGCSIIAAARRIDRLDSLCNDINSEGIRRAFTLELDVMSNGATIKGAVQRAWDAFGRINVLINNAGIRGSGGGSVINISSVSGLNRVLVPGGLAYASSKMALDMLTRMMALELGVHNIRVNSIAPGVYKSHITESLMQKEGFNNVILRTVPLRYLGMTDPALTSLVKYLIHDSSEYVSGNIFIVDSGGTLTGVPIFSSL